MGSSWTPGRVNLIGEWIDFNGGHVLPAALPLGVTVTLRADHGETDTVTSAQFDGVSDAALDAPARGDWADYVFGALQAARRQGWLDSGATVCLDSDIPAGAGVSSSAAVTVGVLKAAAPPGTDPTRLATLAREVENQFVGVPCGIMDQMAVAHTGPGEALALDTRSLGFERLQFPPGWRFAVLHSGVDRKLADGRYSARRDACLAAANTLKVDYLCDAQDLTALPLELQPIARHVISENARTLDAITALKADDHTQFGALMEQSHASLRDDFRVSTPEIDALVANAIAEGAPGARLTGAGFGGCIVAFLPEGADETWTRDLLARHPKAWLVAAVGGAKERT
ncbi:galactokinase [Maricaulis sp.]|uniref:galactokinase n=1 Tax=Maricaulis sp. TaxID=1486257 RepID=UPI00261AAB2B|nr:galactokinase [Maricaulis sp.]